MGPTGSCTEVTWNGLWGEAGTPAQWRQAVRAAEAGRPLQAPWEQTAGRVLRCVCVCPVSDAETLDVPKVLRTEKHVLYHLYRGKGTRCVNKQGP